LHLFFISVIFTVFKGKITRLNRKSCDLDDQNNMLALIVYRIFQQHPERFPDLAQPVVIPVFLVAPVIEKDELLEEMNVN